jgi:hypothetical protein
MGCGVRLRTRHWARNDQSLSPEPLIARGTDAAFVEVVAITAKGAADRADLEP